MEPKKDMSAELESFREQWRAEVKAKVSNKNTAAPASSSSSSRPQHSVTTTRSFPSSSKKVPAAVNDEEEFIQGISYDEAEATPSPSARGHGEPSSGPSSEPVTALDHYEQAVEKESQGSLGESLRLYRKAFRMDGNVDKKYKNKHFPVKQVQAGAPKAAGPVHGTAPAGTALESQPPTLKDLIASFQGLSIEPAPPPVEGMPQPPCPLATLPDEILVHILQEVATTDVADFVRLSQVCKRLAYLVVTEDQIWKQVCLGTEFGFAGMHHHWQRGISWEVLEEETEVLEDGTLVSAEDRQRQRAAEALAVTKTLLPAKYASSWQRMFRVRPRIRFNGCYISTVNYIRSGQASAHQTTWHSPVHIVTYFRYLRFFRDGTAISLTTTVEPASVVHHLTKEQLEIHKNGGMTHLPLHAMQCVFRGRWRLSSPSDNPGAPLSDCEGDLWVETEGVGKYIYRMDLSLRGAGKMTSNNKLAWKGFYSYNKLTDDWGEFGLKNDKPFFFSRVKSYGLGK